MRTHCSQAIQDKACDESVNLPKINVPKFTTENYDGFMLKFLTVVSPTKGVQGVSIDYLLCELERKSNDIQQF